MYIIYIYFHQMSTKFQHQNLCKLLTEGFATPQEVEGVVRRKYLNGDLLFVEKDGAAEIWGGKG